MDFDKLSLQKEYAGTLGSRLMLFTPQSYAPYKANFRCSICGDSQKNQFKKRGYILENSGSLFYYCHNGCGSQNFESYLETYQPDLYGQYKFDIIKQRKPKKVDYNKKFKTQFSFTDKLSGLKKIKDLDDSHEAKQYLIKRMVPIEDVYFTSKFKDYVNNVSSSDLSDNMFNEERIVFPLRLENGDVFGVVGRNFKGDSLKYLTIKFDEDESKIFGLDRIDKNKTIIVVEGLIDSLFLPNSLAMLGTDADLTKILPDKNKYIICLDNQPRSIQVIRKYEKYIKLGHRIVIFPSWLEMKDINDMILGGVDIKNILKIISENTYSGLLASIKLKTWRKV